MLKKMKNRLKDQRGLTLIELLAVIVILGIIAAIAVPSIGNIIDNSKEKAVKADAKLILNAAKLYVADKGISEVPSVSDNKILGKTELEPNYIDQVSTFGDGYKILVSDNGEVEFTTVDSTVNQGSKDGVTVDFSGASLEEIDSLPRE